MKQPLPEKFGKFAVVREIGKGGFGVVYEGRDPVLKRRVAIKTCSTDDASMRQRFQREAEIVASLQHPNITTVHDLGVEDEVPYLVQEYLSGQDLSQFIIQRKELPIQRRLQILRSVAMGLEHAHKRGIVHRDIKPGNVRVLENGTVKVMDFGIAKLTASSETQLTQSGMMIGTAAYLAPEQVSDVEIDHRCDIFSFGVVAYELLTFQRPFAGTTISALLYKINHEEHTPLRANLPSAPAALSSLIDDCLAKDPDGRPISFTKVLERLDEVEAALTGDVQPVAPVGPEDATRLAGAPKPKPAVDAMDLAEAATMVTPSTAANPTADPTAKTMLTPSDAPADQVAEATRIEPTTAERQVSESAMSQMFSNASKPSMIAVAVFALIAVMAVWFALSRGGGSSEEAGESTIADASLPDSAAPPSEPDAMEGDPSASEAQVGSGTSPSDPTDRPTSPPTDTSADRTEPEPTSRSGESGRANGNRANGNSTNGNTGSSAHATERAADRAPRAADRTPARTETQPATSSQSSRSSQRTESTASTSASPPAAATAGPRRESTTASQPAPSREAQAQPVPSQPVQSEPARRNEPPASPPTSQPAPQRASTPNPGPAPTRSNDAPAAQPAPVDHRPALHSVMSAYRSAMENQDGGALQRVWPSLTRRQLQRIEASFAATEAMEIEISDCRFDISLPQATADCRVQRTITPRAGRRQSNTSRSTFSFRQENGSWVLTGV